MNNFNSDFKNVEGIRIIQHTLPHTIQKMEIIPIGDVHVGDDQADIKMLENMIKYVLEKEDRYVILFGKVSEIKNPLTKGQRIKDKFLRVNLAIIDLWRVQVWRKYMI